MGYIGKRENVLKIIGRRDLAIHFTDIREKCLMGLGFWADFTGNQKSLTGTGIVAKFVLGIGIRETPFTPSRVYSITLPLTS